MIEPFKCNERITDGVPLSMQSSTHLLPCQIKPDTPPLPDIKDIKLIVTNKSLI